MVPRAKKPLSQALGEGSVTPIQTKTLQGEVDGRARHDDGGEQHRVEERAGVDAPGRAVEEGRQGARQAEDGDELVADDGPQRLGRIHQHAARPHGDVLPQHQPKIGHHKDGRVDAHFLPHVQLRPPDLGEQTQARQEEVDEERDHVAQGNAKLLQVGQLDRKDPEAVVGLEEEVGQQQGEIAQRDHRQRQQEGLADLAPLQFAAPGQAVFIRCAAGVLLDQQEVPDQEEDQRDQAVQHRPEDDLVGDRLGEECRGREAGLGPGGEGEEGQRPDDAGQHHRDPPANARGAFGGRQGGDQAAEVGGGQQQPADSHQEHEEADQRDQRADLLPVPDLLVGGDLFLAFQGLLEPVDRKTDRALVDVIARVDHFRLVEHARGSGGDIAVDLADHDVFAGIEEGFHLVGLAHVHRLRGQPHQGRELIPLAEDHGQVARELGGSVRGAVGSGG